jgi:acetyl-CoA synthetase
MTDKSRNANRIVWEPSRQIVERSHLSRFMHLHGIPDYAALHARSIEEIPWFTEAILDYLDIRFAAPYTDVIDTSEGIPWAKWCVGAEMNIAHSCLDKWAQTRTWQKPAFIWEGENGAVRSLSYRELGEQVSKTANALKSLGLGAGDAVGIFMPMVPEIVIALLAVVRIGGIILPLFSGYGAGAVATRLRDGEAKALFTANAFHRRGSRIAMKEVADLALENLPLVEHVIVLENIPGPFPTQKGRDHIWRELIQAQSPASEAEILPADSPLMIIYTSGTTGPPKGAVHTHCSFPVKAGQDMAFGTDVHATDIVYWMTDMGWMMGPWLVFGTLILGGTFLIYDGAPDHPAPDRIWDLVARHGVTTLGISPTYVRAIQPHGVDIIRQHAVDHLRLIASTGEPWNLEPWMWLFEEAFHSRLPIINYTGGTEIGGGILMGNPILPIKPCSFPAPCPGIAADVFDEDGQPIRGEVGELVIKAPWIGMTRGFWRDRERYRDSYWSRWKDIWVHGDLALLEEDGHWYVFGRSDDTIKVGGKRIGPAEVESILVESPDVIEAAVIGVPDPVKGSEMIAFCVLHPGSSPDEQFGRDLIERVRSRMGKPFAPAAVYFLSDIPKTRNAKVMRRMLRAAFMGESPGDTSALENPQILEEIRTIRRE